MKTFLTISTRLCVILGCLLFIGGMLAWQTAPAAGRMTVDALEKSFGEAQAETTFPVRFTLENHSKEPVLVAGFHENYCMAQGCIKPENLPLTIAAGKSADVRFRVQARAPGAFDAPVTLFTSCPGSGRIDIRVRGSILNHTPKSETNADS